MKRIRALPLSIGLSWLALTLWICVSQVIFRETRLGLVAQLIDRLPSQIANLVFVFLWAILLLGWLVPIGFGLAPLFRKQR